MRGVIRIVNAEGGYGFISPRSGARRVFFHCSALAGLAFDAALQDTTVDYDLESTDKGPRAVNVRPASELT